MTTLTVARVAELPRVNLLPPEIEQAARLRRLQVLLGILLLAVLGVAALLFTWASAQVTTANDDLQVAQADGAELQQQVASFAEVPMVQAEVAATEDALVTAMEPEIRWSFLMNDMALTVPNSSRLVRWTVTNTAADAQVGGVAATTSTTPTTTPTVDSLGSATFESKSSSMDAVATWLQSIAGQDTYEIPDLDSAVRDVDVDTKGKVYTVKTLVLLSPEAASNRYEQVVESE